MNAWTTDAQTGERVKTITNKGITIVLHRPELTEAVRHQREEAVKHALTPFARKEK